MPWAGTLPLDLAHEVPSPPQMMMMSSLKMVLKMTFEWSKAGGRLTLSNAHSTEVTEIQ